MLIYGDEPSSSNKNLSAADSSHWEEVELVTPFSFSTFWASDTPCSSV